MSAQKGTVPLETSRLHLRRFVLSDEEDVYENWAKDPRVAHYLTWKAHSTRKVTRDMVESWSRHYTPKTYHWAIVWRETGEVIGSVSLVHPDLSSGEIAYALSHRFWGRGVVLEAATAVLRYLFEEVGLSEIYGYCDIGNHRSARVMEKLGMGLVGQETGRYFDQQGNPRTVAKYRLSRLEWETLALLSTHLREDGRFRNGTP